MEINVILELVKNKILLTTYSYQILSILLKGEEISAIENHVIKIVVLKTVLNTVQNNKLLIAVQYTAFIKRRKDLSLSNFQGKY